MAAELVATEILPPGVGTTIFDWTPIPQFGIPIWLVISGFLIVCWLIVIRYWWKRSSRLNSIRGWRESLQKMSQFDVQVWIVSRVQKLTIECMFITDNVLSHIDETRIAMWHVNSSMGIIRVAGNPAVLISEDYDQNRDIITELALCHGCDYTNEHLPELSEKLNDKYEELKREGKIDSDTPNPAELCVPIENADSYDKTGHDLMKNLFPAGIAIPPYNIFNPNRFRKYFPRGTSSGFFGGELDRDAEKLNKGRDVKDWVTRNLMLMVAFAVAGIAILVAFYIKFG